MLARASSEFKRSGRSGRPRRPCRWGKTRRSLFSEGKPLAFSLHELLRRRKKSASTPEFLSLLSHSCGRRVTRRDLRAAFDPSETKYGTSSVTLESGESGPTDT